MTAPIMPERHSPMASKSSLQAETNRVKAEIPKDSFQSLLGSLRDRAVGKSADFLGSRNETAQVANSGAKVFNADGFFSEARSSRPNGNPPKQMLDQSPVSQGAAADIAIAPKVGEPNQLQAMVEHTVSGFAPSNGSSSDALASASRASPLNSPTLPNSSVVTIDPKAARLAVKDASSISISPFRDSTPASSARLPTVRLNLSSGFVEVTGRIDNLSRDDEERLSNLVSEMLAEHGLTLANLKINGLTIVSATAGK